MVVFVSHQVVTVSHMEVSLVGEKFPTRGILRFAASLPHWQSSPEVQDEFRNGQTKTFLSDDEGMYTVSIESSDLAIFSDAFGWSVSGFVTGIIDIGRKDAYEWTLWANEIVKLEMWP